MRPREIKSELFATILLILRRDIDISSLNTALKRSPETIAYTTILSVFLDFCVSYRIFTINMQMFSGIPNSKVPFQAQKCLKNLQNKCEIKEFVRACRWQSVALPAAGSNKHDAWRGVLQLDSAGSSRYSLHSNANIHTGTTCGQFCLVKGARQLCLSQNVL